jgi:hypothetical protein
MVKWTPKRINLVYDDVKHHFHVIKSVEVPFLESISVKVAIKGTEVG